MEVYSVPPSELLSNDTFLFNFCLQTMFKNTIQDLQNELQNKEGSRS